MHARKHAFAHAHAGARAQAHACTRAHLQDCMCSPDQAALGFQKHTAKNVDETLDTVWIPCRMLGESLDTVDTVRGVQELLNSSDNVHGIQGSSEDSQRYPDGIQCFVDDFCHVVLGSQCRLVGGALAFGILQDLRLFVDVRRGLFARPARIASAPCSHLL